MHQKAPFSFNTFKKMYTVKVSYEVQQQNAPLTVLVFKVSLLLQNIVSNSVRRHVLAIDLQCSTCSVLLQQKPNYVFFITVPIRFKYRHNAPFTVLIFEGFSAVPKYRFKYSVIRRALIAKLFSKYSVLIQQKHTFCFFLQFQFVSYTGMHHLPALLLIFSLQFHIVSNTAHECTISRRIVFS